MKAPVIFGIVLRSAGVFFLIQGVSMLQLALISVGGESLIRLSDNFSEGRYVISAILYAFLAVYFLRGAPHLMSWAYGTTEKGGEQNPGAGQNQG